MTDLRGVLERMLRRMDDLRLLAEAQGYVSRGDALAAGWTDSLLTSAVRGGLLVRFRRGSYAYADLWASHDARTRHVVRCRAVLRVLGPGFVLSHVSAAIAHGIVVWGHDLHRVHVSRRDGRSSRVEADVVFHAGRLPDDDVVEAADLPVTRADRAAIETAMLEDGEHALAVFDSVCHLGLSSPDDLRARYAAMGDWRHSRHLQIPIRMIEPGADGPGESRGRWLFRLHRIPQPTVQYEVRDADGLLVGTSDWGWPDHGLLGEFDGQQKYRRLLKPGQDPGEVVFAEKCREDEMREASGCAMVRLIWSDLDRPAATAARVRRLLENRAPWTEPA